MANRVQHSLQTTRNNRGEKEGTRAAQRQWSRAERCTVHGAQCTARVWASLAQRAQLVGSQPGLQKFTKLLQHSQSPHAEEVPG